MELKKYPGAEMYGFFNFQERDVFVSLCSFIREGASKALYLSGPRGIGKEYLLQSVLFALKEAGLSFELLTIDAGGLNDETLRKDVSIDPFIRTLFTAVGMVCTRGEVPESGLPERLTNRLCGEVILVFKNAFELDPERRRWLSGLIQKGGRVIFIEQFSFKSRMKRSDGIFLELTPYTTGGLKKCIKRKFKKNNFKKEFYTFLQEYSNGYPLFLAEAVGILKSRGYLRDEGGRWLFNAMGFYESPLAGKLSRDVILEIRESFPALPEETTDFIMDFIEMAALCGDNIPGHLLFSSLAGYGPLWETAYSVIMNLKIDSEPLFQSTYPGQHSRYFFLSVNSFYVRLGIIYSIKPPDRKSLANRLLDYLLEAQPLLNRGIVRMLLELGSYAGAEHIFYLLASILSWINLRDPGILKNLVTEELEDKIIYLKQLIYYIRGYESIWHPLVIRGLLDSLPDYDYVDSVRREIIQLNSLNFKRLGDRKQAENYFNTLAGKYRVLCTPEEPEILEDLKQVVRGFYTHDFLEKARDLWSFILEKTRAFYEDPPDKDCVISLADTLMALEEYDRARELLEESYSRETGGETSRDTLLLLNRLALINEKMGNSGKAGELREEFTRQNELFLRKEAEELEEELQTVSKRRGEEHTQSVILMSQLAGVYIQLDDQLERAKELRQTALEYRVLMNGPDHPAVLDMMNDLSEIMRRLKDYTGARGLLEKILDKQRILFGPGGEPLITTHLNLAGLFNESGVQEEEQTHLQNALAIAEKRMGPGSRVAAQLRQLLERLED